MIWLIYIGCALCIAYLFYKQKIIPAIIFVLTFAIVIALTKPSGNTKSVSSLPNHKDQYTFLVLGLDTIGDMNGNIDDNMLVQIDNTKKKIEIVSIPRGTNTEITCTGNQDQIRMSFLISMDCALATFENLYQVKIDNYFVMNMGFIIETINGLGGVDLTIPARFEACSPLADYGDVIIDAGEQHLDGYETLSFLRERNSCGLNPDYSTQSRIVDMKLVFDALTKKSSNSIDYGSILSINRDNFYSDMTNADLLTIIGILKNSSAYTLDFKTIQGTEANEETKAIPDYMLDEESLQEVIQSLK